MKVLNYIRRVNHLSDHIRVLKKQAELLPVAPPRLDDFGVLLAPLLLQLRQVMFCFVSVVGFVNQLQVVDKLLGIFVR